MAGTPKRLTGPAYLTNAAANVYNPAANTYAIVRYIFLANTDTVARTYTLYVGATGGSTGGTELAKAVSIPASSTTFVSGVHALRLDPADFLTGLADVGSKVVITLQGELYAV